jgi:hypothetical protein
MLVKRGRGQKIFPPMPAKISLEIPATAGPVLVKRPLTLGKAAGARLYLIMWTIALK